MLLCINMRVASSIYDHDLIYISFVMSYALSSIHSKSTNLSQFKCNPSPSVPTMTHMWQTKYAWVINGPSNISFGLPLATDFVTCVGLNACTIRPILHSRLFLSQYDYVFDWTMLKQKAAAAASATSTNQSGAPKQLEKTKSKGKR